MYTQRHRYAPDVCSCIGHHTVESLPFSSQHFAVIQPAHLHSLTIRDPSLEYGTRLELSPRVSTPEHLRENFRLSVCTDASCRNSIVQRLVRFSR